MYEGYFLAFCAFLRRFVYEGDSFPFELLQSLLDVSNLDSDVVDPFSSGFQKFSDGAFAAEWFKKFDLCLSPSVKESDFDFTFREHMLTKEFESELVPVDAYGFFEVFDGYPYMIQAVGHELINSFLCRCPKDAIKSFAPGNCLLAKPISLLTCRLV